MSAGWRSPGLRSATLPMALSGLIHCHRPERSGLPSAVRGAGAVRFGLASGVRGMPGVGYFSHCAASGVVIPQIANATIINTQKRDLAMISASSLLEDGSNLILPQFQDRRSFSSDRPLDSRALDLLAAV